MSAINAIGGTSAPASSSVNGFSSLSSEEFVGIIFAELTNQDPLEPNDSKALIDQLSSLRSIESDIALTENLNDLVEQTQFAAAAGLVGQVVGGLTLNGDRVLDLVVSVSNTAENGAVLNLFDGAQIPFANVEEILGPLNQDPAPDPDAPTDEPAPNATPPASGSVESDDASSTTDDTDESQSVNTAAGSAG